MGGQLCRGKVPQDQPLLGQPRRGSTILTTPDGRQIDSMLEAFQYCDPESTGYIRDQQRFASLAHTLAGVTGSRELLWRGLDKDGNGAVSFPEFVEWAERNGMQLELGIGDETVGHGEIPLPATWSGPKDRERAQYWNKRVEMDPETFRELQQLLDMSYKNTWTRDRKCTGVNVVPARFELLRALRSENYHDWRRYYLKRHHIVHELNTRHFGLEKITPLTHWIPAVGRHKLRDDTCNEWLLFHGTHGDSAESIAAGDFTLSLAGSTTGTLYGRGTYFAESITKADEYAQPGRNGCCCVLVCRVVGGRVLYNDEVTPDAQRLQNSVVNGSDYHAILGDREKCRGTFKEFVVFDADQIYVEYILEYKRVYPLRE